MHVDLLALDKCDAQPNSESDWTPEASLEVADMEEHTQRGTYAQASEPAQKIGVRKSIEVIPISMASKKLDQDPILESRTDILSD